MAEDTTGGWLATLLYSLRAKIKKERHPHGPLETDYAELQDLLLPHIRKREVLARVDEIRKIETMIRTSRMRELPNLHRELILGRIDGRLQELASELYECDKEIGG
jgi:hypothetical protein